MALDSAVLKAALLYPWNDGEAGTTLVGGGILTLLSPLVLPALLVLGYNLRALERVMAGDDDPPAFGDWSELLVAGLKAAVVLLVYVALPLLVGFVVVAFLVGLTGFRFSRGVATITSPGALGGLALVAGLLLGGLALVVWYLAPPPSCISLGPGDSRPPSTSTTFGSSREPTCGGPPGWWPSPCSPRMPSFWWS